MSHNSRNAVQKKQHHIIQKNSTSNITRILKDRVIFMWSMFWNIIQKPIIKIKLPFQKRKLIPIMLLSIGIILLCYPTLKNYYISKTNQPTQDIKSESSGITSFGSIAIDPQLQNNTLTTEIPLRIVIPSVNIDLPITEAKIINGSWEVSETMASHGMGSSYPGQEGNTVIFAHARAGLFLPLRNVKEKDIIYILTNSSWHRYELINIHEVTPENVEVIKPTVEETLTLFTCTGFADSKRLIVSARPLFP